MNLRSLNLNLLKTLYVLLQTRSVTLASQELFLTQPAVSTSLKQLRELFDDKLLIKGSDGLLELTHKAKLIKPKLEQILKQTENLVNLDSEKIKPEKLDETFHIGIQNHVSAVLFPEIYEKLNAAAPNVKIQQTLVTDIAELTSKELHQFDFIIGAFKDTPKSLIREFYFSDYFICLSGNKKVNRQKNMSTSDLNQYEHVILSYMNNYTKTINDSMLVSNGVTRKYKIICSDPMMAAQLAADKNLLLVFMKTRAEFFKKMFGLKVFELPFKSSDLNNHIYYKEIDADNPVKLWFKTILMDLI